MLDLESRQARGRAMNTYSPEFFIDAAADAEIRAFERSRAAMVAAINGEADE